MFDELIRFLPPSKGGHEEWGRSEAPTPTDLILRGWHGGVAWRGAAWRGVARRGDDVGMVWGWMVWRGVAWRTGRAAAAAPHRRATLDPGQWLFCS